MANPIEKLCFRCGVVKPREAFSTHASRGGIAIYCKECHNAQRRLYKVRNRMEALLHYSGGDPKCACCGERRNEFLALDHTDGSGAMHRKQLKGTNIFDWLHTHGYPEGLRVLCHNCNCARGFYGYCPHEREVKILETAI